ncbi:MAG: IS701 family transposase [Gammaproteobacteria bacterium]
MDEIIPARTPILEHSEAQALLKQARLTPAAVRGCGKRLTSFLGRYLPLFYRKEQRENAAVVVEGLLSGLERKTCEPIARAHGIHRKPVQSFVGRGAWDDEAVMAELRRHVKEELGDEQAVLVIDPSGFAKKGNESCGVKRQWCGRLGKVENCQIGVFLCYAAPGGHAPLDRQLYLPEDWAGDPERREKCHVPQDVVFQEKWRIGLGMLDRCRGELPHGWVGGDDEMGRCSEFRAALRQRNERYVLDVPSNTLVRDLEARRPPRRRARGRKRQVPFVQVREWAARQPASAWRKVTVRGGTKGPLEVEALTRRVRAKDQDGRVGPEERLLVTRRSGDEIDYVLSNAQAAVPLEQLVRAHAQRHRIEQMLEEGKGEAGLGHYEVRGWVGWHHHMTLALLALWFLLLEKGRLGEKKLPGRDGPASARDLLVPAA